MCPPHIKCVPFQLDKSSPFNMKMMTPNTTVPPAPRVSRSEYLNFNVALIKLWAISGTQHEVDQNGNSSD